VIHMLGFRDTFVIRSPYIHSMTKSICAGAAFLLAATLGFGQAMMQSNGSSGGAGSMTSPNAMTAPNAMMMSAGRTVIYSGMEDARARTAKGPVVLMFSADWCPICQADLKDISANGSRLGKITVVIVDYDKEKALGRTYGVTYQHTYVQIDSNGAKLGIWSGGGVDGLLEHVKAM
jgi:thiol-disulfide isomerase/thioredoxin